METNTIKTQLAKIKQLADQDEREKAIDKILSDIEDMHYHSTSQEAKARLNDLSSAIQEYKQHSENGPSALHNELLSKHKETSALEVQCAKLKQDIERLQAEYRQATLRRDYNKSQLKILQEAAEFFND